MRRILIITIVSLFFDIAGFFLSVHPGYCLDVQRRIIHLGWEHDFPPDMDRYEVNCVPGDNASIVRVPIDDLNLKITDANTTGYKSFDWHGIIPATRGRIECYVRAVDKAEQKSGWGGPAVRDPMPATIIHLHFVTSPDIQVEVSK